MTEEKKWLPGKQAKRKKTFRDKELSIRKRAQKCKCGIRIYL